MNGPFGKKKRSLIDGQRPTLDRVGAAVFTLNSVWEVCIYLAQAWPIYYPFIGLAVVGLVVGVIGRLNRSGSG